MASRNSTTTTALTAYPTAPYYANDVDYITAYLEIHAQSTPSYIYTYILWAVIAVTLVLFAAFHLVGLRGGYLGALWSKWAVRRRTWRKKHALKVAMRRGYPHQQPLPLPSNAQIITLTSIVIVTLILAFAGPDYIAPESTASNAQNTSSVPLTKRSVNVSALTQYVPDYTIGKAWWTSGNRTGLIAFALFPLCVLLALKAPPFAVLALPFVIQLHFDKLAWLHRWIGRLIWFFSALHVIFWSVQLAIERRSSTGKVLYTYPWDYINFIYGWIAFGFMTVLVVLSLRPIRRLHYEIFYFLHVMLVPLTLIFSALHHSSVGWWCWAALALWIGERIWRSIWWLNTNGYFDRAFPSPAPKNSQKGPALNASASPESWEMEPMSSPRALKKLYIPPSSPTTSKLNVDVHIARISGKITLGASGSYVPPPGFAYAELLPGRTIRLRLITPGYLPWAPGQHFLLRIPAISQLATHPFTVATVCDQEAPTDEGRELVFLIRAKNGWTKRLWDTVACTIVSGRHHCSGERPPAGWELPARGVVMRTYVDGPFGSAVRARWGAYSTVLIIAGGSGISFGLSVLQYVCLCLAGRDGSSLGGKRGGWGKPGFNVRRVRLVWLVREFSHIQWCATILRRCMSMISSSELQVDIFVTNVKMIQEPSLATMLHAPSTDTLLPPTPLFARQDHVKTEEEHTRLGSISSADGEVDDVFDPHYHQDDYVERGSELGHEEHVLDLTNFEGDDDTAMPGEKQFGNSVKREGRLRRAASQAALLSGKRKRHQEGDDEKDNGLDHDFNTSSVRLVAQRENVDPVWSIVEHSEDGPSNVLSPDSPDSSCSPTRRAIPLSPTSPHSTLVPDSATSTSTFLLSDSPQSPKGKARASMSPSSPTSAASRPFSPGSQASGWSEAGSLAALVSEVDVGKSGEHLRLELDEQELRDVGVVAEHARPGKPRLDRIVADEVQLAQGPIVVGCCGPLSLNAVVRKAIASQINLERIRRGDLSGSITLVSEDFEY
ncbi:uncharacterized protein LAESUDRAFT_756413 [Laetiporus sulphureus 93-53]|uniref:ferric-chelate reductase (NADPH) n=1 Tax=Laetiporus sulphureus 93-53 TaxID=1314785 RepID=A0A165FV55_9APHY|nr:uncharacterized protein LAESUDRAFT_756413 [Laetiporus sulphureus 93-53]KZT09452.1 hypothetical protein LAESUDRAFT_756413 [Laetiporus sulphureus 93-53]